ncbi:MAG: MBL fold metallo-hydrolase, partial [Kangiellaceae bacterium]|nr:MBL fold metallo-hydrolase [Kangiellaceae bacterium]
MKITFLGTSSGVPTKHRNVSGIALEVGENKNWFLIDCGEATQHQLLNTKLSTRNLSAVFITHIHGDHCYGLPGLLASTAMSGRTETLYLIGPAKIKQFIDGVIEATDLFLTYPLEFLDVETLKKD